MSVVARANTAWCVGRPTCGRTGVPGGGYRIEANRLTQSMIDSPWWITGVLPVRGSHAVSPCLHRSGRPDGWTAGGCGGRSGPFAVVGIRRLNAVVQHFAGG